MKGNFRQFLAYNCDVETGKKGARIPTMTELVAIWNKHLAANVATMKVSNNEATLTIGDIEVDNVNQVATFLIRHSDTNFANVVYSDIDAGTFTAHLKAGAEGGETGIHVVISTAQEAGLPNRYTCLIEKAIGLDRNMVRRILNRVLRNEHDTSPDSFAYDSPIGQRDRAGNIRRETCLPRLELEGRPSATLAQDINHGRLQAVTLKRAVPKVAVGGVPFLLKEEGTLKISIDHGSIPADVYGGIKKALKAEAKDYPIATVGFKLPNVRKTVSVKLDSNTGNPLDDLYVKTYDFAGISPPLNYSSEKIVKRLIDLVTPVIKSERCI